MRRGQCLNHAVGAGPTGIFRAHSNDDDDPQLWGNNVQAFTAVPTDSVHLSTAARANQAVGFNDHNDPRQLDRQIADRGYGGGCGGGAFSHWFHTARHLGSFDSCERDRRDRKVHEGQLAFVRSSLPKVSGCGRRIFSAR